MGLAVPDGDAGTVYDRRNVWAHTTGVLQRDASIVAPQIQLMCPGVVCQRGLNLIEQVRRALVVGIRESGSFTEAGD
ncbi:UNVERIFIED_ORG: hypothetical protein ABIC62_005922 [Burkholderia sp. 1595]|uniref:Uncharacterized protein n=1 Tax=Paraburkholderia terricola TaxID=169427 RepID=A0ABU1M0P8_9BURK|nr:hypothetical protein [Paraburkholderia terricola]MDR6485009.1 hypothetical protein [Paraburkholderia terricola]